MYGECNRQLIRFHIVPGECILCRESRFYRITYYQFGEIDPSALKKDWMPGLADPMIQNLKPMVNKGYQPRYAIAAKNLLFARPGQHHTAPPIQAGRVVYNWRIAQAGCGLPDYKSGELFIHRKY